MEESMQNGNHNSHDEEMFLVLLSKMIDDMFDTVERLTFSELSESGDWWTWMEIHNDQALHFAHRFRKERDADIALIKRRWQSEGIKFLTVTLPKLGKWFDKVLNTGELPTTLPETFALSRDKKDWYMPWDNCHTGECLPVKFPRFLQVVWYNVFKYIKGPHESEPLPDDLITLIKQVRSFAYTFYKLEVAFTSGQLRAAEEQFLLNDEDCCIKWWDQKEAPEVVHAAANVFGRCLEGFDPFRYLSETWAGCRLHRGEI